MRSLQTRAGDTSQWPLRPHASGLRSRFDARGAVNADGRRRLIASGASAARTSLLPPCALPLPRAAGDGILPVRVRRCRCLVGPRVVSDGRPQSLTTAPRLREAFDS